MKKTRTYYRYKEKSDFVNFWNSNPSESDFTAFLSCKIVRPYQLFYMVKYPDGGIPEVKIKYRERKKK